MTAGPTTSSPYSEQIAGALGTAHLADALHLDVKPSNILITDYDDPH